MSCLFNFIVKDISEIVIVYSKSFKTYNRLSKIINNFYTDNRKIRLLSKLKVKFFYKDGLYYKLEYNNDYTLYNDKDDKGYTKPSFISKEYKKLYDYIYIWYNHGMIERHLDLPSK